MHFIGYQHTVALVLYITDETKNLVFSFGNLVINDRCSLFYVKTEKH